MAAGFRGPPARWPFVLMAKLARGPNIDKHLRRGPGTESKVLRRSANAATTSVLRRP